MSAKSNTYSAVVWGSGDAAAAWHHLSWCQGTHQAIQSQRGRHRRSFSGENPRLLKPGQARGVAIAAAVASELAASEYAARRVKQSIVGSGRQARTGGPHGACYCSYLEYQADVADVLALPCATSILANSSDKRKDFDWQAHRFAHRNRCRKCNTMLDVGGVGYELK